MFIKRNNTWFPVILPLSAGEGDGVTDTGGAGAGGNQVSAGDTLDSLLSQYASSSSGGDGTQGQQQQSGGDGQQQQQQQQNGAQGQQSQQQDTQGQQGQQTQAQLDEQRRNFAFGQMRQQINDLSGILGRIAQANGIQYTSTQDLISKLNDDALAKLSQKQNIPVELLREMDALRAGQQQWQQSQREQVAFAGFQTLMSQYGLSQDDLKAFAVELDGAGKNPFTQNINVVDEYRLRHFDDIVAKRVDTAVKEALAKSSAADTHSSTPGTQQGAGSGDGGQKITTLEGLNNLLKDFEAQLLIKYKERKVKTYGNSIKFNSRH